MGYSDLISLVQSLPQAKQAEVFDFVELLAQRNRADAPPAPTLAQSPLAELMRHPIKVAAFTPLSREEANER